MTISKRSETQDVLDPRFAISSPLRCEGAGSLDCAEDSQTQSRVAIRWLPVDAGGERVLEAVDGIPAGHTLPRMHAKGRVGSLVYFVTDFPDGKLIASFLNTPIDAARLTRIGSDTAEALEKIHACGMVHGELSFQSVLWCKDGRSMLWDLPLVMADRLTDRRGEERSLVKLGRMASTLAPECARGVPPTAASDVFSLAAILCRLGGGSTPPGATTLAMLAEVSSGRWVPTPPAALPEALRALLTRALDANPAARPSAASLAAQLKALAIPKPAALRVAETLPGTAPIAPAPLNGSALPPEDASDLVEEEEVQRRPSRDADDDIVTSPLPVGIQDSLSHAQVMGVLPPVPPAAPEKPAPVAAPAPVAPPPPPDASQPVALFGAVATKKPSKKEAPAPKPSKKEAPAPSLFGAVAGGAGSEANEVPSALSPIPVAGGTGLFGNVAKPKKSRWRSPQTWLGLFVLVTLPLAVLTVALTTHEAPKPPPAADAKPEAGQAAAAKPADPAAPAPSTAPAAAPAAPSSAPAPGSPPPPSTSPGTVAAAKPAK